MSSIGNLQFASNHVQRDGPALGVIHGELRDFIDVLRADFPESAEVSEYFVKRAGHEQAVKQDLLPLLVYLTVSEEVYLKAMPLAAAWALYLAAAHFLDEAQDSRRFRSVNDGVMTLGMANVALAQLKVDEDALRDILDAVGRAITLGATAQNDELKRGSTPSRTDYFRNIIGKAASIIATGVWIGGRMATDQGDRLTLLKEFGLALGMTVQIYDDCLDLTEDLANGSYTLPVIEGMSMIKHPEYPALRQLLTKKPLQERDVEKVVHLLDEMGAISVCWRMARVYQAQVKAVFELFPGLATYFADYVAPDV